MKRHWTSDELAEYFTILPHESAILAPMHKGYNRIGFIVTLKYFLLEGRFPRDRRVVPPSVIIHLAKQLKLDPTVVLHYDWDGRTSSDHRTLIRTLFAVREPTDADAASLTIWLSDRLLTTHDPHIDRMKASAYQWCRTNHIEPHRADRLERILTDAINVYEARFHAGIVARLSAETCTRLDALLLAPPDGGVDDPAQPTSWAPIQWLKRDPGPVQVATAYTEVARLQQLRALALPADLGKGIPASVLASFVSQVAARSPHELRDHDIPLRHSLLALFCWVRARTITDTLVDLLLQMIHHVGIRAERRVTTDATEHIRQITNKTKVLRQLVDAALGDPDGTIRHVLFPVVDEETLRNLQRELELTEHARRNHVHVRMRNSYGLHYRKMVAPILAILDIRATGDGQRPLLAGLACVRDWNGTPGTSFADPSIPIEGVVPTIWRSHVLEQTPRGRRKVRHIPYEICVLSALRDRLRCKDLWVVGADQYRDPAEDLPGDFIDQRETYYADLKLPLDPINFLTQIQHEHRAAMSELHQGLASNPHVRILDKHDGWIELSPLTAQPEARAIPMVREAVNRQWPLTALLDMLKEADDRTQFTDLLSSLTGRSHLEPQELRKRLLLCIYGLGTNIGLKHMAMGNPDVTAKDLTYVRQRYLSCDHLRNANQRLVNALLSHRDPAIWGEVTSCASDSKKFAAWDQNLLTEWHTRYRGPGVIVYWHVDKKSTCIYSQLKTCSSSEVSAMITGIVRHCTDMDVQHHYVDSHGQSEVAFGLCRLLGFELRPRLKPIHHQKLYLPSPADQQNYSQLTPVLTRAINWELIREQYDELVKYTVAIQRGVAEADAILRRFTRQANHPTYRAMVELGRAIKTIYLCRYLHSLALRHEVQTGLNVIENWNSANSYVFYGRYGEFRTNQRENQELSMLCLHLLQNAMVFINTLMIQEAIDGTPALKHLTAHDFRGLTPLIYQHINPYGVFYLDLRTRLPLTFARAA